MTGLCLWLSLPRDFTNIFCWCILTTIVDNLKRPCLSHIDATPKIIRQLIETQPRFMTLLDNNFLLCGTFRVHIHPECDVNHNYLSAKRTCKNLGKAQTDLNILNRGNRFSCIINKKRLCIGTYCYLIRYIRIALEQSAWRCSTYGEANYVWVTCTCLKWFYFTMWFRHYTVGLMSHPSPEKATVNTRIWGITMYRTKWNFDPKHQKKSWVPVYRMRTDFD